jgi:hypothetical protein
MGREVVVMLNGAVPAAAIVSERLADLLCAGLLESVTVNVSAVALAAAVGVPVIAPVVVFSARPAGSVPFVRDHV